MTIKKFVAMLFIQLVLLLAVKLLFFKVLSIGSNAVEYFYWAMLAAVAVALVRRLGVINYLESIFVGVTWFLANLFFDLIVTARFLGLSMFARWQLWAGYIILMVAIFSFHKKRHIQIRKEQAAHHHSHH